MSFAKTQDGYSVKLHGWLWCWNARDLCLETGLVTGISVQSEKAPVISGTIRISCGLSLLASATRFPIADDGTIAAWQRAENAETWAKERLTKALKRLG